MTINDLYLIFGFYVNQDYIKKGALGREYNMIKELVSSRYAFPKKSAPVKTLAPARTEP